MQHVANVTGDRTGASKAAVEVRDLSHVYVGRDGAVPATEQTVMTLPDRCAFIVGAAALTV